MKLFIANLPHKLSEAELKQMLTQFGQVHSVMLKMDEDGKRKGWGFVEMPVNDQAKAAISALNEKEIYGRKITVKEAEERGKDSSGNFRKLRREYRDNSGEIDGNKW
ncbi:RNA recognition motif. (a.k.a. RRM, RBD, or RNP domain) [Mucilaginibacter pineti]|uniref:RNA recognition motif. (A.k.a. RRM, RBD, or RNP domain) n=1 Tax=Mucilaginibacter pineti TaxID=1391627 RepID=A0A1G7EGK0_9SPHI|nr:hypothetical protein [Mucilaginibacter pineti]SDE62596.1 RNA recognition motif. (a.k.a. RRM, RBD, or RNP domain) [Mucilaginibacter pineti]